MYLKIKNMAIKASKFSKVAKDDIDKSLNDFIAEKLDIDSEDIANYDILSRSLDARKSVKFIYTLWVELKNDIKINNNSDIEVLDAKPQKFSAETFISEKSTGTKLKNPLIVGSGPGGMFAAYLLALAGTNPIIIDRGQKVELRDQDINDFFSKKKFNTESNLLFGEGGAGTYSDGKLYSRINDPRAAFILESFIDCGAEENIRYLKRPHLGSDKLPGIIKKLRERIKSLGGRFIWGKKVESLLLKNGKCLGVILADGEKLETEKVIVAQGLGGEQLTEKLLEQGVGFSLKNFQIGCRIEHLQQLIDQNQYRKDKRPAYLDPAEYNLVNRPPAKYNIPGTATFCMCPGGTIVPVMNEEKSISTNGMSNFERNGDYANSCLIVTQNASDFQSPQHIFEFLRNLRRETFSVSGDYRLAAQDASAFARRELALSFPSGSYNFSHFPARIDQLLPSKTAKAISKALIRFEKIFPGFMEQGTIVGTESFISSPVRFARDEALESSIKNLYIAGEGAGQAGGIISAAVDGLKIAEAVMQ